MVECLDWLNIAEYLTRVGPYIFLMEHGLVLQPCLCDFSDRKGGGYTGLLTVNTCRGEELIMKERTTYRRPAFPAADASDASLFACPASAAGAIKKGSENLYPKIVVLDGRSTPGQERKANDVRSLEVTDIAECESIQPHFTVYPQIRLVRCQRTDVSTSATSNIDVNGERTVLIQSCSPV